MACPHCSNCPLFPLLEGANLGIWKTLYCDNEERFRECERYKLTLAGQDAPITLLPNGVNVSGLKRP